MGCAEKRRNLTVKVKESPDLRKRTGNKIKIPESFRENRMENGTREQKAYKQQKTKKDYGNRNKSIRKKPKRDGSRPY